MNAQNASKRVLIVEDDGLQRLWLRELLEDEGFAVLAATNGDRALERLEADHASIRCVVTDVQMPGLLDGVALTQTIQARWPAIHVIILSGFVPVFEKVPGRARVLAKPIQPEELVGVLESEC